MPEKLVCVRRLGLRAEGRRAGGRSVFGILHLTMPPDTSHLSPHSLLRRLLLLKPLLSGQNEIGLCREGATEEGGQAGGLPFHFESNIFNGLDID